MYLNRLKFDLSDLANEILDKLPVEVFESDVTTFCDPCMGGGQFIKAVEDRLKKYGHSDYNINERVFGFGSIVDVKYYKAFGKGVSEPQVLNILKDECNMKFDVVIGNPPYQNTHGAKRWPLWHQFVNKAQEVSDIVAFVVPASLVGPGKAFQDIKNNVKTLSLDVDKHFNVGSTFCYFIYDKSYSGKSEIITSEKSYELDLSVKEFLPLKVNERSLELLNKLNGTREWKRGEFHTSDKEWQSTEGVVVHHTNAQTLHTNSSHENLNKIRVCVTLSGYPKFKAIQNEGCSQANFWTEFDTMKEAEEFASVCNGPEIQEIVSTFKWSGWNSKEVIQKL